MQLILSYFWQMCLLRVGPEKIPQSITITGSLVFVFFLVAAAVFLFLYWDEIVFWIREFFSSF